MADSACRRRKSKDGTHCSGAAAREARIKELGGLDEIRATNWRDGYDVGFDEGMAAGLVKGRLEGFIQGLDEARRIAAENLIAIS